MSFRHILQFTVCLKSPFIMAGIEHAAAGVDTPALRDELKRPIIPADHLKGLLRQAASELPPPALTSLSLHSLFGSASPENHAGADPFAPARGRILFGDLAAEEYVNPGAGQRSQIEEYNKKPLSERTITRIKIDDETGTAEDGMLQEVELAAPLAAKTYFTGKAIFHGTRDEADELCPLLNAALKLVPFFGGQRSAGYGEHVEDDSAVALAGGGPVIAPKKLPPPPRARMQIDASFDRPFLVDAERLGGNIFVGRTIIPGGVIKGALADMLVAGGIDPRTGDMKTVLSEIRISHAFPLDKDDCALDRALPLSATLIRKGEATIFRCGLSAARDMIGLIDNQCADFQADWKGVDFAKFSGHVGRPNGSYAIPRFARGHTRIDPLMGAANDEDLFVEVARGALLDGGDTRKFRFQVDFGDHVNTPEAAMIWAILSSQLDGVGKNRAVFTMSGSKQLPEPRENINSPTCRWRVLLETPAALFDPDSGEAPDDNGVPLGIKEQLKLYIKEVIPEAILDRAFLRYRRAGGYPGLRFRNGGGYRPIILFDAGSCFSISCEQRDKDKVGVLLATLERTGLPSMRWEQQVLVPAQDWLSNPYVPENGYGEISVEDPLFDMIGTPQETVAGTG